MNVDDACLVQSGGSNTVGKKKLGHQKGVLPLIHVFNVWGGIYTTLEIFSLHDS
jgi:hypothetical protein